MVPKTGENENYAYEGDNIPYDQSNNSDNAPTAAEVSAPNAVESDLNTSYNKTKKDYSTFNIEETSNHDKRHNNNKKCSKIKDSSDIKSQSKETGKCFFLSSTIVSSLENFFYWYGKLLARHPLKAIFLTLVLPLSCSLGLIRYNQESNPYKLWIPQDSDYIRDHEWLWENFPDELRFHSVILTGENVLTPYYVNKLLKIHKTVTEAESKDGKRFEDICYKVPMVDLEPIALLLDDYNYEYDYEEEYQDDAEYQETDGTIETTTIISEESIKKNQSLARYKRSLDLGFDPSVDLYTEPYCDLIDDITEYKCLENSILEIWAGDNYKKTEESISNLNQQDIVNAVNNITESPVYDTAQDFSKYLGGVERNSSGHIIGAKAMFIRFFGSVNFTAISSGDESIAVSKGNPVDAITLAWEQTVIQELKKLKSEDESIEFSIARSFSDLSAAAINSDAFLFGVGTSTVFIYVQFMLGKFNFVEFRPGLSAVGMGCFGLSILTSYGFCSGVGLVFSPLHAIIPFLMMGIGVDDMFVIIQCLYNLEEKLGDKKISTEEKMGLVMKNAGVAITVTSLTDFIVFAIGATTVLPALRSFCIYCAVGIISVYFYQSTIFTATLALDIRRVKQKRNGLFPWIKHLDWTPNQFSQKNFAKKGFKVLGGYLRKPVIKILVLAITASITGIGVYGLTDLKQEFDPIAFIPRDSYLTGWFEANNKYFPKEGERVKVNIADIDYRTELPKLEKLVLSLMNQTDILTTVDSWLIEFRNYTLKNELLDPETWLVQLQQDQIKFYELLTQFLFSQDGAKYRTNFNFVADLMCGEAAPRVQLSSMALTHKLFDSSKEWVPAMNRIKNLVKEANFSSRAFPTGTEYASWETDEVIGRELYQNLGLSLLCVFMTTLVLLASLQGCALVLLSVFITLVDVGGFMHFWGLTIDVISCTNLVIAVGLVVDYSAHIVHAFLIQTGSKEDRIQKTLEDIGPAVLNGGFSTFLAFIFTVGSTSHVFISFFKIFFLVVVFGLFHGLIALPVVLSLVGPTSHKQETADANKTSNSENETMKNCTKL